MVVTVGETGIVTDELSDVLNHNNVPAQPVAVKVMLVPDGIFTFACTVGVIGTALTLMSVVTFAVHPLAFVTVTVYVPE